MHRDEARTADSAGRVLEKPVWALGLMSGTSMDGVDAALLLTDGLTVTDIGPTLFRPYAGDERAAIAAALPAARDVLARTDRPEPIAAAEHVVTEAHIAVVADLVAAAARAGITADVIGFHGQTVFHAPERGLTVQIGDGQRLAAASGLQVVYDLRAADVAAGGQGAPLVPIFHRALVARADLPLPVAVLNVGGVANVTFLGDADALFAFDTGPGNALMDDLLRRRAGLGYDDGGRIAAGGRVDEAVLADLMEHPFFAEPFPKSLDRDAFSPDAVEKLQTPDALATLAAFTAASVAAGIRLLPSPPQTIVVAGGGARNPVLVAMIAARSGIRTVTADSVGIAGDFVEAQAFGYLAARRLAGLPVTFPGTTGVMVPTVGGVIAHP
ncbi:anhydro-N-acetylmuramic acid kinase [Methylobrevis albus]|uniref:Anhydro-N-acetylmuramic acid kinase n=1 Tax=Methylobrevis albus TaxID=2793297 RepID=A0A931N0G0_9HYPH|nr:anhydro-N-acetylmuramic acid kinase [Methylobrevis albus]MBH0239154.1 anhydro-N-acetylmuramic acid kinase [Methylobrevis albus]